MTITVSSILSRAATLLLDETGVRWPSTELLLWAQDGLYEMALLKPTLFTELRALSLVAGTVQSLPDGVRHIHRIISNTNGPVVRIIDRRLLDSQQPNWPAAVANTTVKYVMTEDFDEKHFYCSPPNTGTGSIQTICTVEPAQIAADSVIAIDAPYANPILSYVLYRAFQKDADTSDEAKAQSYYETFTRQMSGSVLGDGQTKEA
jgi:hypothetical protein